MDSPGRHPEPRDPLSILVVDDDPDILFATARILRSAGYTVHEAETGEACLLQAKTVRPQLALLDVILPDISGHEVCKRLKQNPETAEIYVVLISCMKTQSAEQAEGLEIGADGYIARPVPQRELLARVESLARIIRAERERDLLIEELRVAAAEIKMLQGLLPVCASCKMVRKDDGYWEQLEVYLEKHTNLSFTHGVCPPCATALYGKYINPDPTGPDHKSGATSEQAPVTGRGRSTRS